MSEHPDEDEQVRAISERALAFEYLKVCREPLRTKGRECGPPRFVRRGRAGGERNGSQEAYYLWCRETARRRLAAAPARALGGAAS
jgi:hypothetical protein